VGLSGLRGAGVLCVAITADGGKLAAATGRGQVAIWDLAGLGLARPPAAAPAP
jgi:uncharacterized membrane protein